MEYVGYFGFYFSLFLGISFVWILVKCVNICICIKSMVLLILKNGVY